MKEATRFSVMKQIDKKILSIRQASHELGLSTRQVKRLWKRYKQQRAKRIISLRKGRPNARRYPETLKIHILELRRKRPPKSIDGEPRLEERGMIWKGLRSPPKCGFKLPGPEGPGFLLLDKSKIWWQSGV